MTTTKIVNVQTGEEIEREMNAEELAQQAKDNADAQTRAAAQHEAAAARQVVLDRLGITADEARLLLGGN
jgi:hypothetical protein